MRLQSKKNICEIDQSSVMADQLKIKQAYSSQQLTSLVPSAGNLCREQDFLINLILLPFFHQRDIVPN